MWATLALGGLVTPAQVAGFTPARVGALMQDRGGLATQALVVKTLTLGIDPTQTVGRSVVCREF